MNAALPPDARIIASTNSNAFLPRPFITWEAAYVEALQNVPIETRRRRLVDQLRHSGTNILILDSTVQNNPLSLLRYYQGQTVAGPIGIPSLGINPWKSRPVHEWYAVELDLCGSLSSASMRWPLSITPQTAIPLPLRTGKRAPHNCICTMDLSSCQSNPTAGSVTNPLTTQCLQLMPEIR